MGHNTRKGTRRIDCASCSLLTPRKHNHLVHSEEAISFYKLSILQIKQIDPDIKVIIFTHYESCDYLGALMTLGVSGYVLKKDPLSDLQLAIEAVSQGGSYLSESICRLYEGQTGMLVH